MFIKLNKRGQSTAEYAILIAVIIGAAIAMQTYFKRSWQAGVKYAVDKVQPAGGTGQYEPYYLQSDQQTTVSNYSETEEFRAAGEVRRTVGAPGSEMVTTRTGDQLIRNVSGAD